MNANIARLRAIVPQITKLMPEWDWTVLTRAEVAENGRFDPPCAVLVGRLGPFSIEVCGDGETYLCAVTDISNIPSEMVLTVDMAVPPAQIAKNILDAIRKSAAE
jgi:hypothetical protein